VVFLATFSVAHPAGPPMDRAVVRSTASLLRSHAKAGKGRITYIGAWLDDSGMAAAAKWMTDVSGVRPPLGAVPDGVEVNPRYGPKGADYILVNLSKSEQTVTLPSTMTDVLAGSRRTH
jgi:hypothetical protein